MLQAYNHSSTATLVHNGNQLQAHQCKNYTFQGVSCVQMVSYFTCDQGSVVVCRSLDRWYKSENRHHHNLHIEIPQFHLHQELQLQFPFPCKTYMPLQNIDRNFKPHLQCLHNEFCQVTFKMFTQIIK